MTAQQRIDRYRQIEAWARKRATFTDEHGVESWTTRYGFIPSRYTVIEELAAERYIGLRRRYPGFTLALAADRILPGEEQDRRRAAAKANAPWAFGDGLGYRPTT